MELESPHYQRNENVLTLRAQSAIDVAHREAPVEGSWGLDGLGVSESVVDDFLQGVLVDHEAHFDRQTHQSRSRADPGALRDVSESSKLVKKFAVDFVE